MVNIVVDKELIKRVARNARLNLCEEEIELFTPQIKEIILESFNKLDELDVSKEKPSFQPVEVKNSFREDKVKKSLTQEEALRNVKPELREKGFVKGPKVV